MTTITVIALAVGFASCFAAGAFSATKGVQIGLRWQMQAKAGSTPTMKNPIKTVADTVIQKKIEDEARATMEEYLLGSKEEQARNA